MPKIARAPAKKSKRGLPRPAKEIFRLRLFVAGATEHSARAIANIKEVCEAYLKGRYELEVVDLYQQPAMAREEQIIAAPTLLKKLPLPVRRLIGDLSTTERVLVALDLHGKL